MAVTKSKITRSVKSDPEDRPRAPLQMPESLTLAMRKRWENIAPSITEAERPYMDRVWDALRDEVRKEQDRWFNE